MSILEYFEISTPLMSIATGLTFFVLLNFMISTINRIRKLPDGPWGLPVIGYLPFIKEDIYLAFDKLAKRYGPVFSLKMGQHDVVVICDWAHLKLALADEPLLARPYETFIPGVIDDPSFIEMSGNPWREHRRLSLNILRDVGLGKSMMETLVNREIEQFIPTIEGDQVDFIKKLLPSVSNIISCFLFGHSYDYSDPFKIELDDNMERANQIFQFAGVQAFMPWLTNVLSFFNISNLDTLKGSMRLAEDSIQKEVDLHKAKDRRSDEVIDYIDGYLLEQEKREAKGDDDELLFNSTTLRRNLTEFFGAGSETTTSTLSWAMLYLVNNPEYQDKIRSEISEVIGYDRAPNYADRNQMPFTMAFLYEAQRIGSVVAVNVLRRAARDTQIGQYTIPKDTLVIFNFWSIHREDALWPEPEKFDPNRFLTDDGTKTIKPPYLVPFGGGKRICIGEGLANVELFLYLVSIVQRYFIKAQKMDPKLLEDATFGATRRPKHLPLLNFIKFNPSR